MLKEKNFVAILKEENINTLETAGELLLTTLSAVAQQESENISEHVKLGLQIKMNRGELVGFNSCYGYKYNSENKELLTSKDIMEEFDQEIFDALVDYVIIGGYDENGTKDQYLIRFILKREFDLSVPKEIPEELSLKIIKLI